MVEKRFVVVAEVPVADEKMRLPEVRLFIEAVFEKRFVVVALPALNIDV